MFATNINYKQLIHYTMNPELTWFVISYSYGEAALNVHIKRANRIEIVDCWWFA